MASDQQRVKYIKQKRTSLKTQITVVTNYVEANQNDPDLTYLKIRLERIEEAHKAFDDLHDELKLIEQNDAHDDEKSSIDENFFMLSSRITKMISPDHSDNSSTLRSNSNLSNALPDGGSKRRRPKLPTIEIPKFSGKFEDWISFKNQFISIIHNDPDLNDSQKLMYLNSALDKEVKEKIRSFSTSDENYKPAWDLLLKSYDNKWFIISRHINLLLGLPSVDRNSKEGVSKLIDQAQQHLKSLAALDINLTPELVIILLEKKLPNFIVNKWHETVKSNELPILENFIDFIYEFGNRLCLQDNKNEFSSTSKERPPKREVNSKSFKTPFIAKKAKIDNKHEVFLTSTSKIACPLCKESHPLYRCKKFKDLNVEERLKTANDLRLCKNCLRCEDPHECNFVGCIVCHAKHNTLLHKSNDVSKKSKA